MPQGKGANIEGLLSVRRLYHPTNIDMQSAEYDVVIVGGGPAGCAAALSVFKYSRQISCLIIDDSDPANFKIGESLPAEAIRVLHHLDPSLSKSLSQQVASNTHRLCTGNASSWASATLEERHAILNPFGHGLHLDRAVFDETLREAIVRASQANGRICLLKGRVTSVMDAGDHREIGLNVDDETMKIRSKWVVDASGRKASAATKLGRKTIIPDPLLAFYALFVGPDLTNPAEGDNDNRTLIEATADGWFYSSLLSRAPCTRVVAFHTLPSHSAAKRARRRDGFLDLLQASAPLISQIIAENDYTMEARSGYPRCTAAGTSYLDKICDSKKRCVAVGDAAVAFDPLSSQGMVTALEVGTYIGMMLARHLEGDVTEKQFEEGVEGMYGAIREDYARHRKYYYSTVQRFKEEEFWKEVSAYDREIL